MLEWPMREEENDFSLRYWIMAPPRRRRYYISLFFLYISIKNTRCSRFRSPVITSFHVWNIAAPLSRGTPTMTLRFLKNELTFAPRASLDFLALVAEFHIPATSPRSFIFVSLLNLWSLQINFPAVWYFAEDACNFIRNRKLPRLILYSLDSDFIK